MADERQIGVHYCGGCNPRYDRAALVKRVGGFFPEAEFVTAQAGAKYPAVLVIYDCPSRCANVSDLAMPARRLIYLSDWEGPLPVKEELAKVLRGQQTRSLVHEEVLDILPHREPMLFIDTVNRLVPGEEAVTSLRAWPELPRFAGHFPGIPVLPGVCTIEATAQAADTLVITTEHHAGRLSLFMGVQKATFRWKILPGDSLEIHVSPLEEKVERAIAVCRGQVFVEDVLAAGLELRLAFRQPNKEETM